MNVDRLIKAHLAHITLAGKRPTTIRARRVVLVSFADSLDGRSLLEADRTDYTAYLAKPGLKPESRRTYRMHLRGFARWALEEGHINQDPTERIPPIKVPRGEPRPIDEADLRHALARATPRMAAWLLLMAQCGLRCCEVSLVRPEDVMEGGLLHLREQKGGASGSVPLHAEVLEALLCLPIRNGLWWSVGAKTISHDVAKHLRACGVAGGAHALRHRAATVWLRQSGQDLLTTSFLMRHASVESTQRYAKLAATRPAEVIASVPHLRAV